MPAPLDPNFVNYMKVFYENRVPAKEAAQELNICYQTVYSYYRGFKASGVTPVPIKEILLARYPDA